MSKMDQLKQIYMTICAVIFLITVLFIGYGSVWADSPELSGVTIALIPAESSAGMESVMVSVDVDSANPVAALGFNIVAEGSNPTLGCSGLDEHVNCNGSYAAGTARLNRISYAEPVSGMVALATLTFDCADVSTLSFTETEFYTNDLDAVDVTIDTTALCGNSVPLYVGLNGKAETAVPILITAMIMLLFVALIIITRKIKLSYLMLPLLGLVLMLGTEFAPADAEPQAAIQLGDTDCDGAVTIIDMLLIDQNAAGAKLGLYLACPDDPTTAMYLPACDADLSQTCSVEDTLQMAQCDVSLDNVYCTTNNEYTVVVEQIDQTNEMPASVQVTVNGADVIYEIVVTPVGNPDQQFEKRWLYLGTNFLVTENSNEALNVIQRAADAGYNGIVLADAKLDMWFIFPYADTWLSNITQSLQLAKSLDMEVITRFNSLGYCGGALAHNPNLTSGYPMQSVTLIAQGGVLVPEVSATLTNGSFENVSGNTFVNWGYQDYPGIYTFADTTTVKEGLTSLRIEHNEGAGSHGNARASQVFAVEPYQQYRLRGWFKAENFTADGMSILIRAEVDTHINLTRQYFSLPNNGGGRSYFNKVDKFTTDWVEFSIPFNSLQYDQINIMFGAWGLQSGGRLWFDDLTLDSTPTLNVLRRDSLPMSITSADGTIVYQEGVDYATIIDPYLGNVPWSGSYTTYQSPPVITLPATTSITDGETVYFNGYHALITTGGQVSCSWNDDDYFDILSTIIQQTEANIDPDGYFNNIDEVRTGGWDSEQLAQFTTSGEAMADSMDRASQLVKDIDPTKDMYVWSDMFSPNHNAVDNYYQVNGSLEGSWEGIPLDVTVVTWPEGSSRADLQFFSDRGHDQIIAGYYDDNVVTNYNHWMNAATGIPNIKGAMYTTWIDNYDDLELFADIWWGGNIISCIDVTEIPVAECNALADLYHSTDGFNWSDGTDAIQSSWLRTNTPCTWYGITCTDGHVTTIRLMQSNNSAGVGLSGQIPLLTALTHLTHLKVANNQLSGTIAQLIPLLPTSIETLELSGNTYPGGLPATIENLPNLRSLYISLQDWAGTEIPPEIGNLMYLEHFQMYGNGFSGSIPPEMGNLNLTYINLGDSNLTGGLSVLGNLDNLERLSIQGNDFMGPIPSGFINLNNLNYFDFQSTDLCEPTDVNFQNWLMTIDDLTSTNVLCETTPCTDVIEIPVSECETLIDLYNSTDGSNWSDGTGAIQSSWLQTNTPCTWYGITCTNGHVTTIRLRQDNTSAGVGLSGQIPSLTALTHLTHLKVPAWFI